MSLGGLQDESDLKRFIEKLLRTPGILPASAGVKAMTRGIVEVPYPGESHEGSEEVEHNLGVEPSNVLFTAYTDSGIRFAIPELKAMDDSSFTVVCFCPYAEPEAGAKSTFIWTAVV